MITPPPHSPGAAAFPRPRSQRKGVQARVQVWGGR
jgi:hypothetical protein